MKNQTGFLAALAVFVRDVYAPGLHIAFAAIWFLALDSGFAALSQQHVWHIRYLPLGVATFFVVLFYLRVIDEWKDFAYDQIYNPTRPLVRGAVTFHHLYGFLIASAAIAIGLLLLFPAFSAASPWPPIIITADLAYGLLLVALEKLAPPLRDGMLLNLVVTYPVNVALSVFAYAAWLGRTGTRPDRRAVLLIVSFALAFLHYEFARKIAWSGQAIPGKRLYSAVLGQRITVALAILFAVGAAAMAAGLFVPISAFGFAPLAALLPVLAGTWRFARLSDTAKSAPLAPFAMGFLALFYATVLCIGITSGLANFPMQNGRLGTIKERIESTRDVMLRGICLEEN